MRVHWLTRGNYFFILNLFLFLSRTLLLLFLTTGEFKLLLLLLVRLVLIKQIPALHLYLVANTTPILFLTLLYEPPFLSWHKEFAHGTRLCICQRSKYPLERLVDFVLPLRHLLENYVLAPLEAPCGVSHSLGILKFSHTFKACEHFTRLA